DCCTDGAQHRLRREAPQLETKTRIGCEACFPVTCFLFPVPCSLFLVACCLISRIPSCPSWFQRVLPLLMAKGQELKTVFLYNQMFGHHDADGTVLQRRRSRYGIY